MQPGGILCFQHCEKRRKIFCFSVPPVCPLCGQDLATSELRIPPFRVPCPFGPADAHPCAVLIKPTRGDFLNHYQNSADLHIGLTDAQGCVREFDSSGLKLDDSDWKECLPIPVITSSCSTVPTEPWKDYWDYMLEIICRQDDVWNTNSYDADNRNCYTFVMSFLRSLELAELKKSLSSKTAFTEDFIVPRTRHAAKYIALYRQLYKEGICVQG